MDLPPTWVGNNTAKQIRMSVESRQSTTSHLVPHRIHQPPATPPEQNEVMPSVRGSRILSPTTTRCPPELMRGWTPAQGKHQGRPDARGRRGATIPEEEGTTMKRRMNCDEVVMLVERSDRWVLIELLTRRTTTVLPRNHSPCPFAPYKTKQRSSTGGAEREKTSDRRSTAILALLPLTSPLCALMLVYIDLIEHAVSSNRLCCIRVSCEANELRWLQRRTAIATV